MSLKAPSFRRKENEIATIADAPRSFEVHEIGCIHSPLEFMSEAPHQGNEGGPDAWIVLAPEFEAASSGLKLGDRLLILTWLHLADRSKLEVHPRSDQTKPLAGVFGTRSPHRPNPIGLHEVNILQIAGPRILVGPIEAVHGTPILDIKPVLSP